MSLTRESLLESLAVNAKNLHADEHTGEEMIVVVSHIYYAYGGKLVLPMRKVSRRHTRKFQGGAGLLVSLGKTRDDCNSSPKQ